jgi:hypothetical protein
MDYNTQIKNIAKRNASKASAVLILSSALLIFKIAVSHYDGNPQSAMVTALLAFIAGAALATTLRWDIVAKMIRR